MCQPFGPLRSTQTAQFNLSPAQLLVQTGHPYAYLLMLAVGGVRGGLSYGQSDEIGYYVAEDPVTPKDLQATLLHLLGLDPYRFGYEYQGLFNRLIGPTDEGKILTRLVV